MNQILNRENEKYYIAYAMGYSDGNKEGINERSDTFNTPEEKYLYKAGYERGVTDYCYYMEYGRFED